jgi:hypothetical protein
MLEGGQKHMTTVQSKLQASREEQHTIHKRKQLAADKFVAKRVRGRVGTI